MHNQRSLPRRHQTIGMRKNTSILQSASRTIKRTESQTVESSAQPPSRTEPQKRVTIEACGEMPSGFEQQNRMPSMMLASDIAETELMSAEHIGSEHASWKDLQNLGKKRKIQAGAAVYDKNIDMCKEHAFCAPDRQEERIPIEVKVTYPLPWTSNMNDYMSMPGDRRFLNRVANQTFGESGAQRPGTKTVLTQYSLDHYLAQQWNLDVDNMPNTLPESMASVQKRFNSYTRKNIQHVKISQSDKPTLKKKFNEWDKAKLESKQRQLELLYFRSNQDPKVLALLEKFQEQNPNILGNRKNNRRAASQDQAQTSKSSKQAIQVPKMHKRMDKSEFRLEGRDMVPLVYQNTMKVDPLVVQLQKEHDEVVRMSAASKGTPFGELAQKYYENKEEKEKEDHRKKMSSMHSMGAQEKSNYLPSSRAVKKRMDSEHLNSFLIRSEIQYVAERRIEFNKLLSKATPQQLQDYRTWTAEQQSRKFSNPKQELSKTEEPPLEAANEFELTFANKPANADENNADLSSKRETLKSTRPLTTSASKDTRPHSGITSIRRRQRLFSQHKTGDLTTEEDALQTDYTSTCLFPQKLSEKDPGYLFGSMAIDSKSGKPQVFGSQPALAQTSISSSHRRLLSNQIDKNEYTISEQSKSSRFSATTPQKTASQRNFKVIVSASKRSLESKVKLKTELYSRKKDNSFNTRISFAGKTDAKAYSTSIQIPVRRPIYHDLIEAQEGKGRVANMFKSARWQQDKDLLIASMSHHMQRHRPRIQLTGEQEKKRIELAGRSIEDNQRLQQRLTKQYGLHGMPDVEMPPECVLFLKEPQELQNAKLNIDKQMRHDRDIKMNPCTQAVLQEKAFEALNRSTQQSETSKHHRPYNSVDKIKTILEVPMDPKPDIFSMTATRFEQFNSQLTKKIETKKFAPKARWKQKRSESATGLIETDRIVQPKESGKMSHLTTEQSQKQTPKTQSSIRLPSNKASVMLNQLSPARGKSATRKSMAPARLTQSELVTKDITTLECNSPGIGAKAKGRRLKELKQEILRALDIELVETIYIASSSHLTMSDCDKDQLWLKKHFKDMDGPEFWQQKGLLCSLEGKSDAAMDYYRQGLRKNPSDEQLLYSLALSYLQLKKFESSMRWFSYGLRLNPRWVDGLCGCAVAYFNMQKYEKALQYIMLAKNNFKTGANRLPIQEMKPGELPSDELPYASQINLTKITLIKAICLKETQRLDTASQDYISLEETFSQKRAKDLISMLWGCILVPLSNDRRLTDNHYRNMKEMLQHITGEPVPNMDHQNLLLSRFCFDSFKDNRGFLGDKLHYRDYKQPPPMLDFEKYNKSLWTLIRTIPFFKRFNNLPSQDDQKMFADLMKRAEVELYRQEQPVFLNGRVAVVSMGSCEVRNHSELNLLKPIVLKKAIQGDVIGAPFNEDADMVLSPLTWFISMQNQTEVVFFKREDFQQLWNLHHKFTEHNLVIFKLNQNKYFRCLNKCTKVHLVHDCLDLRNFYPGQLLLSVHTRSPLSTAVLDLFSDGKSKFRKEIDNRITQQLEKHASAYQGFIDAINQPDINKQASKAQMQIGTSLLGGVKNVGFALCTDRDAMEESDEDSVEHENSLASLHASVPLGLQIRASSESRLSLRRIDDKLDQDQQSDGTDFGVSFCLEIMEAKKQLALKDLIRENDQGQNDVISESESEEGQRTTTFEIKEADEGNLETDQSVSDIQTNYKAQIESKQTRQTRKFNLTEQGAYSKKNKPRMSVMASRSPSKRIAHQMTLNTIPASTKSTRDPNTKRAASYDKKPSMKSKFFKAKTMESGALKRHDMSSKCIDVQKDESFLDQDDLDSTLSKKKKAEQTTQPMHMVQYNFLLQRYISQIEGDDRPTKKEFGRRKDQIKHALRFVSGLKEQLTVEKSVEDTEELQSHLQKYQEQFRAGRIELQVNPIPEGTSGFWNARLIEKMNTNIEEILLCVGQIESANEIILKFLIDEIDNKYAKQLDPDGIHFIAAGDAYVIGPQGAQNMKLHPNDCFGESDFVKTPGPEFLGDVRAGLVPVQTYYLSFQHLRKRISIQEKLQLYQVAAQDDRMDGIMKFVIRKDNIEQEDKMRNY